MLFFSSKTAHIPTSLFIRRVLSKLMLIPLYTCTSVYMEINYCIVLLYSTVNFLQRDWNIYERRRSLLGHEEESAAAS